MILLDTNIVSELRKTALGRSDRSVRAWEKSHAPDLFAISVITVQEIELGIMLAEREDPAKAEILRAWFEDDVLTGFADRILSYDIKAAKACAALNVERTLRQRDGMVAAIALVQGLSLATRNTRDFAGTGVRLINPWDYRVGTGSGPE